jgi:hypothetical protein
VRPAVLVGDPRRGGPGGDSPGLEHDQRLVVGDQAGLDQGDGNPGRLAGTGRSDEDQAAPFSDPIDDLGKGVIDREPDHEASNGAIVAILRRSNLKPGRELARVSYRMLSLSNSAGNPIAHQPLAFRIDHSARKMERSGNYFRAWIVEKNVLHPGNAARVGRDWSAVLA